MEEKSAIDSCVSPHWARGMADQILCDGNIAWPYYHISDTQFWYSQSDGIGVVLISQCLFCAPVCSVVLVVILRGRSDDKRLTPKAQREEIGKTACSARNDHPDDNYVYSIPPATIWGSNYGELTPTYIYRFIIYMAHASMITALWHVTCPGRYDMCW